MLSDYTLNKETPIPLYFQLKTLILDRIKDGTFRPGDLIPTEIELSAMFNISRTTVRQAVTELVRDGYLYRIKSKGTFVAKPKINQRVLSRYFSHDEAIRGTGRDMKVEILKKEVISAPQFLVDMGLCQSGEKVIYLYRRRMVDGEAMTRTVSYLSYEKFADYMDIELEHYSLRALMARKLETRVYKLKRTIEAVPATKEDIIQLDVDAGTAIQLMTTIRYNEAGEFLDLGKAYNRGDMSSIEVEIVHPREEE